MDGPLKEFVAQGGKGPIQRLRAGGFDLDKIKVVMLSHQHFDRTFHITLLRVCKAHKQTSETPSPHQAQD